MSQTSKTGTIKIKRNPKVFELYQSGDTVNTSNIILKFLLFALLFLALVVTIFYFYSESLKGDTETESDNNTSKAAAQSTRNTSDKTSQNKSFSNTNQINQNENNVVYLGENSEQYREAKFLTFSCNTSICYNNSLSLPVPLVTQFIKSKNMNLIYSQNINKNYIKLFISCSEDFYMFLNSISNQGSSKNEEKSFVNGFFPPAQPTINQSR